MAVSQPRLISDRALLIPNARSLDASQTSGCQKIARIGPCCSWTFIRGDRDGTRRSERPVAVRRWNQHDMPALGVPRSKAFGATVAALGRSPCCAQVLLEPDSRAGTGQNNRRRRFGRDALALDSHTSLAWRHVELSRRKVPEGFLGGASEVTNFCP